MVGTMLVMSYYNLAAVGLLSAGQMAVAFAINFAVSSIVSRAFAPSASGNQSVDNGVRQQVPPSSTNSIPVIYGDAYCGGRFVDAVLSTDAKTMYYVMVISHISPNGQFSFNTTDMYWGDRKITFDGTDQTKVISLTDGAGNVDTKISGNLYIALYKSTQTGVISSTNGASLPSTFMGGSDIPSETRWSPTNRQMNGLAFAIIKLNYNRDAETTGMQTVTFKASHYLNNTGVAKPGDVWYDYITNELYGAAMSPDIVNANSATALNAYSDEVIPYTENGGFWNQPRYRINGVVDTGQSCLSNINAIMIACDSWNQYNAALGQWSIVINKAETTAYAFNDSNIIGEIRVSAFDITSSVNQIEAEFPSKQNRDQSEFVYYETPANLLYPNEPINKQSVQFSMVNDSVQAQYLASRILEQAREDLIVTISTAYTGIQVDAGDVISITNSSYGWTNKLFRVMKVAEISLPDGNLGATFDLNEYNAQVYDDRDITKYTPAPNTDLPDPSYFGVIPAPTIAAQYPTAAVPSFDVQPYMGTASFASYAEIWYSAFANPTSTQIYLGGTTSLPSNGVPFVVGQTLPTVNLQIPAGNWYLFTRIINGIATSQYSTASAVFNWRPTTFQYTNRWIAVAYADNATGTTGFSLNPRNKSYFGLFNNTTANGSTNASDYTWYAGSFESANYLLFANRSNRKFSFAVGNAAFPNVGGTFVPTETSIYDTSIWGALQDGLNYIDLDARTGQNTRTGTTSTGSADGLVSVINNTNGSMVVSLEKFLNFGSGVYQKTITTGTLTIDVFGRIVGYVEPDDFYYTEQVFDATAGQTTFNLTHIVGQMLVFMNGMLLDTSEYTESSSGIVMATPCAAGAKVVLISMRAVSKNIYYEDMITTVAQIDFLSTFICNGAPYQWFKAGDLVCFSDVPPDQLPSPPDVYTVDSYDPLSNQVFFSVELPESAVGLNVYRKRLANASYAPFTRITTQITNQNYYNGIGMAIRNGFESFYVNGVQFNEIDYDLSGNQATGFPAPVTGRFTFIQFAANNFGVPASNVTNTVTYSASGAITYPFPNNPLAMQVYANGMILINGFDYTANSAGYNLTQSFPNNFTLLNQQTFARIGAA